MDHEITDWLILTINIIPIAFSLGVPTPMQKTMTTYSLPISTNKNAAETGNLSTTPMNPSDRKRKETKAMDAPEASKRCRGRASTRKTPSQGVIC